MYITRISLDEFRRYHQMRLIVPQAGLRIVGQNASGKSSLLEALLLLATTKSPRVITERELIRWESGEDYGVSPYARISAHVETDHGEHALEIRLESQTNGAATRKTCLVDDRSVRATTMVGVLKVVEFSPEDVQLVAGPPADRRRQLDILISQMDRHYMQISGRYAKVLTQRNGLLRSFTRDGVAADAREINEQLSFWDNELVQLGSQIVVQRINAISELSTQMQKWSDELLQGPVISLAYDSGIPHLSLSASGVEGPAHQVMVVAERFHRELRSARNEEIRRGTTTIGPQRDDVRFLIDDRLLAAYGSRGQQRLGVIALKLSEADIIEQTTGEKPVLLLDDALSELDVKHASWLLSTIAASRRQLLLTSAIPATLDHPELDHLDMITLGADGSL